MIVGFDYISSPPPRLIDLMIARLRHLPPLWITLPSAAIGVVFAVTEAPALAFPVQIGIGLWWIFAGPRARSLRRDWRAARARRATLNGARARDARRCELLASIASRTSAARAAWDHYLSDAMIGRMHSVVMDRPGPRLQPVEALATIREDAERLGIRFVEEETGEAALPLTVSPDSAFEPDRLSPTLMNLSAASLSFARAEGPRRAKRRRQTALAHATRFAPLFADAEEAILTLKRAPSGQR